MYLSDASAKASVQLVETVHPYALMEVRMVDGLLGRDAACWIVHQHGIKQV